MKRKLLSLLMALALMVGLMPAALAADNMDHFKKVNDYPAGKFTDVAASSWYAESVQKAYELDLVKGSSGNTFSPTQNLTISSTLALACRLHSIYEKISENVRRELESYTFAMICAPKPCSCCGEEAGT